MRMIELHGDNGQLVLINPGVIHAVYCRTPATRGAYVHVGADCQNGYTGSTIQSVVESVEEVKALIVEAKP